MKAMTADDRRAWSRIRSRGRRRYVAVYGVMSFGLPMMVGGAVLARLVSSGWQGVTALVTTDDGLRDLTVRVVFGVLSGLFLGSLNWRRSEKRYAVSEPQLTADASSGQDLHEQ